jgi:hypothetical protein
MFHLNGRLDTGPWPTGPENKQQWKESQQRIAENQKELIRMINDTKNDLFEPFDWSSGQTLLREVLVLAEHNAYHTGIEYNYTYVNI